MLLMFIAINWTDKQEKTEPQVAIPQIQSACTVVRSNQSARERTISHLYTESLAIPASTTGDVPGYNPTQSKSKSLHTTHRPDRYSLSALAEAVRLAHSHNLLLYHIKEYYIYTLKHIII